MLRSDLPDLQNLPVSTTVAGTGWSDLPGRYRRIRAATRRLAEPLSAEDCCAQSMPDASPVKWHLAHTTWFFETFVLERFARDFKPFDPAFRVLFNSYYNGVGERHPRPQRGLLTRPDLDTVMSYRDAVDGAMQSLLAEGRGGWHALVELGLQHEQQHQELMLTDIKHLLSCHPSWPLYRAAGASTGTGTGNRDPWDPPALSRWMEHQGGLVQVGHAGEGFCFDNEAPRHTLFLQPFALAERLVSNAEYLAFVRDGGYRNPEHWLAEGWDWRTQLALESPLYWRRGQDGGEWQEFTLHGAQALVPTQPVVHLSYFEADAFARWSGARLPTEAEWEVMAARSVPAGGLGPANGHFAERAVFHPEPGDGDRQLLGSVWQWTSSSYAAYPGFVPAAGAVGEYNGKFMVNQYVLRGGSCATPAEHIRASYRNFFPATARWQFTGLRLARDLR